MLYKLVVLNYFAEFTQRHLCQALSFVIRLQIWGLGIKYFVKFTGKRQWLLLYLLVNMIRVKSCEQLNKLTEFFVPYSKFLAKPVSYHCFFIAVNFQQRTGFQITFFWHSFNLLCFYLSLLKLLYILSCHKIFMHVVR